MWRVYALLSALFATLTIIFAKVILMLTWAIDYFGCRLRRYSLGDWPRCLVQ